MFRAAIFINVMLCSLTIFTEVMVCTCGNSDLQFDVVGRLRTRNALNRFPMSRRWPTYDYMCNGLR